MQDLELPPQNCCQEDLLSALLAPPTTSRTYISTLAEARRVFKRDMFDRVFREYDLDVLITPADSTILPGFGACAGYVTGTVPLGQCENGLPFGLGVYAPAGQEEAVLGIM